MPGHSPSKTGVNALMVPGIHVFFSFFLSSSNKQGVHGRDTRAFTPVFAGYARP
jgi:hypothetical protein